MPLFVGSSSRIWLGLERNSRVDRDHAKVRGDFSPGSVIDGHADLGVPTHFLAHDFKIALKVVPVFLPAVLHAAYPGFSIGDPKSLGTQQQAALNRKTGCQ